MLQYSSGLDMKWDDEVGRVAATAIARVHGFSANPIGQLHPAMVG
jgi:hypothetical protein